MNILVLGGTRFFGIPMVEQLLADGHEVTIGTRGRAADSFGDRVKRVVFERTDSDSIRSVFAGKHYDVVIDKIAYCSNDIKKLLDIIDCDRYIYMSSTAVYEPKHINTVEEDFDGAKKELIWCDRPDFPYDEIKRHAECALSQVYPDRNWIAVRYPFVIGRTDYTERLRFYVEHVMKGMPMYIDNIDSQMGFIGAEEAGRFIAYLVDKDFHGPINGCSTGTISLREVIDYVEKKTGCKAVLSEDGDKAPYNEEVEYSINTEKAAGLGFEFSVLKEWIYDLIDFYIGQ
ncbi:MAG: NAD-dependent epimerase/dehydratase family protein [Eubacterium sp.]|nr:NAD-dependent epimerase/dehydratase family protein [Eubacterium sp.]